MIEQSNILLTSIERFIIKHFRSKLIKGLLLSVLLLGSVFLFFNFIEYVAYLSEIWRLVLFYSFLGIFLFVLIVLVLIPAYKLIGYRKAMSVEEAALIIGKYFPEINDKLLNTIQLARNLNSNSTDIELLTAAVEQKTNKLALIPFTNAVNLKDNYKYLRLALIPIGIVIGFLIIYPSFITQPSQRIVLYNTHFTKPLPFEITILNENLSVLQNDNFVFSIEVTGLEIPEKFFIEQEGTKIAMERGNTNSFTYTFKKVGKSTSFIFTGGEFRSNKLTLEVYPKPLLLAYEAQITYPAYTKRQSEKVENQSFLSVSVGSTIKWKFYTRNVDSLLISVDSVRMGSEQSGSQWVFDQKAMKPSILNVQARNQHSKSTSDFELNVDVIQDEFPSIIMNVLDEEMLSKNRYFTGLIGDDYGFSKLELQLKVSNKDKSEITYQETKRLAIDADLLRQQFFYYFSMDSIVTNPGDQIGIQFAVYDNDQVNGPKVRFSNLFAFQVPSNDLLDSISRTTEEDLNKRLDQALSQTKEIQKELADFNKKLMLKKELDWNDRQKAESLIQKQKDLEAEMDQLKNDREKLNQFNKDNDQLSERMLEKQAQIDKLLEEVVPEDIRKMMEELQKLLQEINKDQMSDMLKKMEQNSREMEKQLDRNLALLKQLQVEKEMNALLDRLEKLSKELEQNAEKTDSKEESNQKLSENLDQIKNEFKKEMNRLDTLKKDNEQLEEPFSIDETSDEEKDINDEMTEGKEQLGKKKNNESAAKQKSASEKMKKMKEQIELSMQQGMEEQMAEDAAAVRFLLENVIRISMSQEGLMQQLLAMRPDDPLYVEIIKEQSIIAESFKVVDDSLTALSKRQPMIENFIFEEVKAIKFRMTESMSFMKERVIASAGGSQQFAMLSLNNLALMLAESLKNMQDSMGMPSPGQGKGKGKGKSPGKSLQNMRELQESLGNQLKDAMDGKSGKDGGKGMSEEVARMAAQQEAIRQQLKNMLDELKSEGAVGDGGLNSVLQDMEKFEEDLVNKRLNQDILKQQNDIVVRLLESEKAQKERDKEERRESNEFKGENNGNLRENLEYNRLLKNQKEILRINPIDFNSFYKQKVNQYFIRYNVIDIYEKKN